MNIFQARMLNLQTTIYDVFSFQGDSGGPLVIKDFDGNLTQVGLVSFGLSLGCENSWPSVYTRLTEFLDFIAKNSDVVIRD